MPDPRPDVKLEVLKTETANRTVRQLVRFEGEPGIFVEGYLIRRVDANDGRKAPESWPCIRRRRTASTKSPA